MYVAAAALPCPPSTEVPNEVKVNTRAVLLSSKGGVGLKRFNRDYKTLVGESQVGMGGMG